MMRQSTRLRRMLLGAKRRKQARDPLRRTATEIAMMANMLEYRRRCLFQIESTPSVCHFRVTFVPTEALWREGRP